MPAAATRYQHRGLRLLDLIGVGQVDWAAESFYASGDMALFRMPHGGSDTESGKL